MASVFIHIELLIMFQVNNPPTTITLPDVMKLTLNYHHTEYVGKRKKSAGHSIVNREVRFIKVY